MNMLDSSFLCLDIGSCGVRGLAYRLRNAEIDKCAYYSVDDFDTVFALKSVIDELERQNQRITSLENRTTILESGIGQLQLKIDGIKEDVTLIKSAVIKN